MKSRQPPAADEAETEMGGNRSSETSEDAFKSNPREQQTTGDGKPTERWQGAQDVEHQEGVPHRRSRLQGGPDAVMPDSKETKDGEDSEAP
ncbi:MAG TPA: hypothetical protein VGN52_07415 [Burkholderiales bacterium]|jgi:hypothetical protein